MAIKTLTSKDEPLAELGAPTVLPLTDDQVISLSHTYGGDSSPEERIASAAKHQFVITWAGCVLALGEHNRYHDSDFYAIVWDAERGVAREIEYGTTRGWTYWNSASVDATEEAKAAYEAYKAERRRAAQERRAEEEAMVPRAGRTVKTLKVIKTTRAKGGLTIPVGTEVEVKWYGEDSYRSSRWANFYRIGFDYQGQRVFTSADNVEVVRNAERDMLDKIAAKIWPGQHGVHADDITMKLMELAHEWREAFPAQCASMDKAVEDIDAGRYEAALNELCLALGSAG